MGDHRGMKEADCTHSYLCQVSFILSVILRSVSDSSEQTTLSLFPLFYFQNYISYYHSYSYVSSLISSLSLCKLHQFVAYDFIFFLIFDCTLNQNVNAVSLCPKRNLNIKLLSENLHLLTELTIVVLKL